MSEQTNNTSEPDKEVMVVTGTSGKSYYLSNGLGGMGGDISSFKSVLKFSDLITDITFSSYIFHQTHGFKMDFFTIQDFKSAQWKLVESMLKYDFGMYNSTTVNEVIDPTQAFGVRKYYSSGIDLQAEKTTHNYAVARANNFRNELLNAINRTLVAYDDEVNRIDRLDPVVEIRQYLKKRLGVVCCTGTPFETELIIRLYYINVFILNDIVDIDALRLIASRFNTLTSSGSVFLRAPVVDVRSTRAIIPACRGFASKFFSHNLVSNVERVGYNLAGVAPALVLNYIEGDFQIRRIFLDMNMGKAAKIQKSLGTNAAKEYAVKLSLDKSKLTASSAAINATSEPAARAMLTAMFGIMFCGGSHFLSANYTAQGQVISCVEALMRKVLIPDWCLTDDSIANIDNTILVGFIPLLLKTLTPSINADRVAITSLITYIHSLDPASYNGDNYLTDILLNAVPGAVNIARLGPAPAVVRTTNNAGVGGNLTQILEKPVPSGFGPDGARAIINFLLSDRVTGAGFCGAFSERIRNDPDKAASSTSRAVPMVLNRNDFSFGGNFDLIDLFATSTNGVDTISKNCYEYNPSGIANQFPAAPIDITRAVAPHNITIRSPLQVNHQREAFRKFNSLLQSINSLPKSKSERDIFTGIVILVNSLHERYDKNFDQFTLAVNNQLFYHGTSSSTNIGVSRNLINNNISKQWFNKDKLDGVEIPEYGATSLIQLLSADTLAGIFSEPSPQEIFNDEWELSQALCDICALNLIPQSNMFETSVVGGAGLALAAPAPPAALQASMQGIFNMNSYENPTYGKRARFNETVRLYQLYGYKHDFIKTLIRLLTGNGEHSYYDLILPIPSLPRNRLDPVGFSTAFSDLYEAQLAAGDVHNFFVHTVVGGLPRLHNRILIKLATIKDYTDFHLHDRMSFGISQLGFVLSLLRRTRVRNDAIFTARAVVGGGAVVHPNIYKGVVARVPVPVGNVPGMAGVGYSYANVVNDYRTSHGSINEYRRKMDENELNDVDVHFHILIPYTIKQYSIEEYYSVSRVHNCPISWKDDPFVNLNDHLKLDTLEIPVIMNVQADTLHNTTSIMRTEPDYLVNGRISFSALPVDVKAFTVKKEPEVLKFATLEDWVMSTTLNYNK